MVEIANGSRSDVTVVLLGHDQAEHRARAQYFHQQAGIACQVVEPLQAVSTGAQCSERLAQALRGVTTPLVMLALDADFVQAQALDNAAAYLFDTPQAIGAQGHALAYVPADSQVAYYKVGHAFPAAEGEDSRARLRQHALANQPAWRAVIRLAVLPAILARLPKDLDFAGWRVALSYALLAEGPIAQLDQTDVICEFPPRALSAAAHEEQLSHTVRTLRQWDAEQGRLCTDDTGFIVLNRFVRGGYDLGEAPLLFTSRWASVIGEPDRRFEPRQYVELPYYNAALFDRLAELEFLCHAWPTGQAHRQALEGAWVRQRQLLEVHPNDTAQSLQQRYWQALACGLFNREVCERLLATLSAEEHSEKARELRAWLERLDTLPGLDVPAWLATTDSGQVLKALEAAAPDNLARERVLTHLARHPGPQLAFIVADLDDDDIALQATFDSLLATGLRNFKLVVLKGGKPPAITTARDTLHFIQVNAGNWVSHLNQVVRQLPSEWLVLLQAGDVLASGGLLRLKVELIDAPGCDAICANEVQRDADGRLLSVMRPGSDLDLLRRQPGLMSRHWLVRRQAVIDLGGYDSNYPQALEFDLLLRLAEAKGVGSLAHMDEFLVIGQQAPEGLHAEALAILNRHLTQLGYRGQVSDQGAAGLAIDFRHCATPLVSVLLAGEGDLAGLQRCLTGVFQRTRYPRYEVLVACAQGHEAAMQEALGAFGARVRVVSGLPGDHLLNVAAGQARGEYLVLLSARSQVITPAWIEALLNEAQRPEVGIVGARLLSADGSLAHAGYELLAGPHVHAPWAGLAEQGRASGEWQLAVRGCAAVSGDCLMVRKAVFEHCGGLKGVMAADVDLCLATTAAGALVVWTPLAQVLVDSFAVPGGAEAQVLAARWPEAFTRLSRFDGPVPVSAPHWLAQFK